ncbi:sensor domain-containing diguanylate cyclase [Desulfocurvus sp. DL9XJH121]
MQKIALRKRIPFRLSFILVGLLLMLSALIEVFIYQSDILRIKNEINRVQMASAQHLARSIDRKLTQRTKSLAAIAELLAESHLRDLALLDGYLQNSMDLVEYFSHGFGVVRPDGKSLMAERFSLPAKDILPADLERWCRLAGREKGVVIGKAYRARGTGIAMLLFAAAIRDASGGLLGVLVAPVTLDSPDFLGFLHDDSVDFPSDVLIISRRDRLIVASSRVDMILKPALAPGVMPLRDRAMEGYSGVGIADDNRNIRNIVAIEGMQSADWFVVVHAPLEAVLRPAKAETIRDLFTHIVFIALVVVVIFGTLTIYFRPLNSAAEQVRRMEGGKALPRLPQTTDDEIGYLIAGFNTLVGVVNERTSALERANKRLQELSHTDGLTKVFNRRNFDRRLRQYWRAHQRSGQPLSLIILDIDHFKKYNDTYGHQQGDAALVSVASALHGMLKRPTDVFARYGGEEFAAIVENDEAGAVDLAESMRLAVENLALEHAKSPHGVVTISLGVASLVPGREATEDVLIRYADEALYAGKENGRNRVEVSRAGNG